MKKGNLSKEQAIEAAGIEAVEKLSTVDCYPTNRVQCDGDTAVEFKASVHFVDAEGYDMILAAYYYQEDEKLDKCDDLSMLDWAIEGYEIEG